MTAKLENHGAQIFEDHEILEILLFFSLPRINTNEIAHRLIEHFGSLKQAIEAPKHELITVDGIGEHTADLLKTVCEIVKRCSAEKPPKNEKFDGLDKLGQYAVRLFTGETQEKIYAVLLDQSGKRLHTVNISTGNIDSSDMIPSIVVNNAAKYKSSNVVLAHNHPRGYAHPSEDDILMTARVRYALSAAGLTLIEHFAVSGNEYYPIMEKNKYKLKWGK